MTDPKPTTNKLRPSMPQDPSSPVTVALIADGCRDPALSNATADQIAEYIQTRDESLIASMVSPGEVPTLFTLQPLSLKFLTRIVNIETNGVAKRQLALRSALTAITGPGAVPIKHAREEWADCVLVSEETLEAIARIHGADSLFELGDIAILRARLRPGSRAAFGLGRS